MNDNYQIFSALYAELFDEALYMKWRDFTLEQVRQYMDPKLPRDCMDIACGDGSFLALMQAAGYQVSGIDLSAAMLTLAMDKLTTGTLAAMLKSDRTIDEMLAESADQVNLAKKDMREFSMGQVYSLITCYCDSLCYLPNLADVRATCQSIYKHLRQGGLFIFDLHSPYQMNHLYPKWTYVLDDEDALFSWQTGQPRGYNTIDHYLNYFVRNEAGFYERFEEQHEETTWEIAEVKDMLEGLGFKLLEVSADFGQTVTAKSTRLFYTCQKEA